MYPPDVSAFGDTRGSTGLQTLKVVHANKQLEGYLNGDTKGGQCRIATDERHV